MIKMNRIAVALIFATISVAQAQAANEPVSQGAASVNKNLTNNPDNKGLQTASEQLKENEAKIAAKRAQADKTAQDAKSGHDSKAERPAKPERPGK